MGQSPQAGVEHVVRRFVAAINRRDLDALAALMTPDHVFVDGGGARMSGREAMKAAWAAYFNIVPDYEVLIEEIYLDGPRAVLLGTARGSYAGEPWRTPAAWRAVERDGLIAEWRVYCDNEPIRKLIARRAVSE